MPLPQHKSSPDFSGLAPEEARPQDPSAWGLIGARNPSRKLTGRILEQVRATVVEERPLYEAAGLAPDTEVDVVVSGGGLRGYYCVGSGVVLSALASCHGLKVRRISGASAGAWVAVFMACDTHPLDWCDTYYESCAQQHQALIDGYRSFIPEMLLRIIPEDAYLRCSGRAFISISTLTWAGGLQNVVVSQFTSNQDLLEACMASCTIPGISTKILVNRFRGSVVLDGGCTNNLPVFTDNKRRQILFDMNGVEYPFALSFSPSDRCIESLVLRGAVEMRLFLLHRTTKGDSIDGGGSGKGKGTGQGGAMAAARLRDQPSQPPSPLTSSSSSSSKKRPRAAISWGRGDEAYGLLPSARTAALRCALAGAAAWSAWGLWAGRWAGHDWTRAPWVGGLKRLGARMAEALRQLASPLAALLRPPARPPALGPGPTAMVT